jgi:NAD+ synthase (glutamine-hydrolysing)
LKNIRIALAQVNPTVGDIKGNTRKTISYINKAKKLKADVVAFPELMITGYPPEDLLLKHQFIDDNIRALDKIRSAAADITAVVGFVDKNGGIFNAAALLSGRKLIDVYYKKHLPNYGVFDEYRYFKSGTRYPVYCLDGVDFGVSICEDMWFEEGPAKIQALSGAQLIININASPYHMKKSVLREDYVSRQSSLFGSAFVYVNMVGGQDELVFDGGSFVVDSKGNILVAGSHFKEELIIADMAIKGPERQLSSKDKRELKKLVAGDESVDKVVVPGARIKKGKPAVRKKRVMHMSEDEEIYNALLLGTRDYVRKNGFNGVVIGMSGGVDSALVATIAVDALGRDNVNGVFMPSVYTSDESFEDARSHAKNLGIKIETIPIDEVFRSYLKTFSKRFRGLKQDITEENLQARIRGNLLMALSNKFGWLVLTTGNKSEMSVGYATLYGDMAGGFAVIKDVPKTLVYNLCEWRNNKEGRALIPERILWKEPTAELRPGQRDSDSLPPYPQLDPVLKAYVEEDRSFDEIMEQGSNVKRTKKIIRMVDVSEYKRRQAPPGIKITPRAFGKDRRFPITNRYKSY